MILDQKLMGHIAKAFDAHYIDSLSKKNSRHSYQHNQGGGILIQEEDADLQQQNDYFEGKRKTKPTAMDGAKAIARQEERMANGTLVDTHVTPDIHEDVRKQVSMRGSLQKHLPKQI